ncbi:MAG: hypothetical protein IKW60_03835 [Clostridia bacterium]|nr:hypothetical protein [Clostridia bacterium]
MEKPSFFHIVSQEEKFINPKSPKEKGYQLYEISVKILGEKLQKEGFCDILEAI